MDRLVTNVRKSLRKCRSHQELNPETFATVATVANPHVASHA